MPHADRPPEMSLAWLDLRTQRDALSFDGAVRLDAGRASPALLRRLGVAVVVLVCDADTASREESLRVSLEEAGVQVCRLRLDPVQSRVPVATHPGHRLVHLLAEAVTVAESVTASLDEASKALPDATAPALARLSPRECEVLAEVRLGKSNKAIGRTLFLSPHTVGNHLRSIYRKLGVTGRHDLLARLAQR